MGTGTRIIAAALALAAAAIAQAQAPSPGQSQRLRIHFAEKVDIPARADRADFNAYGRRFTLLLEDNERLLQAMPGARKASLGSVRLLRGRVDGRDGSWVRLTLKDGLVSGAFWDGAELYLVARHSEIAGDLQNPLDAPASQTVVYRAADTENLLPANFCATFLPKVPLASGNGLSQYKALVNELKLQFVAPPTDRLDISLVVDSALAAQYAGYSPPENDVRYFMLNAINVVDGIFDAQVGLQVTASELNIPAADADPFTSFKSSELLEQLSDYRATIPELLATPVTHLVTRRMLDDGDTLGIAQIGGACDAEVGVSLTAVGGGGFDGSTPIIMAHEIAHNLNAVHDDGACGANFLMWPTYNGATRFSQCSIDQIRPFIEQHRGSCFISPDYADVAVRIGDIPNPLVREAFTWPIYLKAAGTRPVTNAVMSFNLRYIDLDSVTPTQGACAPLNGDMRCQLGTLAPGVEARVDITATPRYPNDTLNLSVTGDATEDRYETNSVAYGAIDVKPQATVGLSVNPENASAYVGDTASFTFTVAASGPRTSRAVVLNFTGDASYLEFVSLTPSQGSCAFDSCQLGDISSGGSAQVTATVRPKQGMSLTVAALVSGANIYAAQQSVSAKVNATATFDLAIEPPQGMQTQAVGVPFDIVVPVRANGTRPVPAGRFRMNLGTATFISADVSGTPCASDVLMSAYGNGCDLGTLNPGDSRTVTVRARFDAPAYTNVYMAAEILNDELWTNNSADVLYRALYTNDVSVTMFPNGFGDFEGRPTLVTAVLHSVGAQDASNVTATLDVPAGLRIQSATLAGGTCVVANSRRATCTRGSLQLSEQPELQATVIGDEPGLYTSTWTVSAANDGLAGNNTVSFDFRIRPHADVGVRTDAAQLSFVVNHPRDVAVEVFTGPDRPVPNVVLSLPSSSFLVLDSVTTPVGTCDLTNPNNAFCNLGTLPAGSVQRIMLHYRAVQAGGGIGGWIKVQTPDDFAYDNDMVSVDYRTYEEGDMRVRLAAARAAGTIGGTLVLPTITVDSGTQSAYDVLVDIPIPSFASIESISSSGLCSGGAVITCYLGNKGPNTVNEIGVTLKLNGTGTFTSNVVVSAANDVNPANDTASLQIQSDSVAKPSTPSAPAKKSGGGSMEWPALAFLALCLLVRRHLRLCPTKSYKKACVLRH